MALLDTVRRALRDPNPIVRKELLTLLRTPAYVWFLFAALIVMGLIVVSVALSSDDVGGADTSGTGRVLFQVFFSLTTVFVVVMGATLAAVSITLERENRTLDALKLSALGPRRIVAGKLVAVFLATAFVPVSLLPVLGVVFLFGGISVGHIAVAAVYSLALGALGIAAGTAVSARATTTRRALLTTVPVISMGTLFLGSGLVALGENFRRSTSGVFSGPFFFADTYLAEPFSARYAVAMILAPVYLLGAGFWLAYASAYGGLMDETEDRARPVKHWAVATLAVGLASVVAFVNAFKLTAIQRDVTALAVQTLLTLLGIALAGAFAAEPVLASARVRSQRHGILDQTLFPPALNSAVAFVIVAVAASALLAPVVARIGAGAPTSLLLVSGAWVGCYVAAMTALAAAASAQSGRATLGRVILVLAQLFSWVLVWVATMLFGSTPSIEEPGSLVILSPVWVAGATGRGMDLLARGALSASERKALIGQIGTSAALWALVAAGMVVVLLRARRRAEALRAELVAGK